MYTMVYHNRCVVLYKVICVMQCIVYDVSCRNTAERAAMNRNSCSRRSSCAQLRTRPIQTAVASMSQRAGGLSNYWLDT